MTTTICPNMEGNLILLSVALNANDQLQVTEMPIVAWSFETDTGIVAPEATPLTIGPVGLHWAIVDRDSGRAWGRRRYPDRDAAEHDLLAMARLALSQEDMPELHAPHAGDSDTDPAIRAKILDALGVDASTADPDAIWRVVSRLMKDAGVAAA